MVNTNIVLILVYQVSSVNDVHKRLAALSRNKR